MIIIRGTGASVMRHDPRFVHSWHAMRAAIIGARDQYMECDGKYYKSGNENISRSYEEYEQLQKQVYWNCRTSGSVEPLWMLFGGIGNPEQAIRKY